MKTKLETVDLAKLSTVTGGNSGGSLMLPLRPPFPPFLYPNAHLKMPPKVPTIPLRPFMGPKPDPRVA
jgi:hypothetical protein